MNGRFRKEAVRDRAGILPVVIESKIPEFQDTPLFYVL